MLITVKEYIRGAREMKCLLSGRTEHREGAYWCFWNRRANLVLKYLPVTLEGVYAQLRICTRCSVARCVELPAYC